MRESLNGLSWRGLLLVAGGLVLWSQTSPAVPEPIARWVFEEGRVEGNRVRDAVGDLDGTLTGSANLKTLGKVTALLIDRDKNKVEIPYDPAGLPKKEITVEAWLDVEKTDEWGGIIGAQKGEQGWLLGERQSSFSFSVAGKDTPGMTHVRDLMSLEKGRWYHVVGTYDGKEIRLYVDGELKRRSNAQSGEIDYPQKAPFVIGSLEERLGVDYMNEIALYDEALTADEVRELYEKKKDRFPPFRQVKLGPTLRRLDDTTVRIEWETSVKCPSVVLFDDELPVSKEFSSAQPTTRHRVTLNVEKDRQKVYYYRIRFTDDEGEVRTTRLYEFDASMDYGPVPIPVTEDPYPPDEWTPVFARATEKILKDTGVRRGYCLVLGCKDGRLAFEIARRSDLSVICVDDDPETIAQVRESIDRSGVYGMRITALCDSLEVLPFTDYMANLIVSESLVCEGKIPSTPAEVFRVLRPAGGTVYFGQPGDLPAGVEKVSRLDFQEWWSKDPPPEKPLVSEEEGVWCFLRRPELPNHGEWTHQYANAANDACSGDPYTKGPMQVLWFGRPGPRPMVDRGTRSPAPLSCNGRLFVQGDRRIFGMDAYNGTIWWTLEIPDLRRANMPRDCGNMVATEDALYLAVRGDCWRMDPDTGTRVAVFPVLQGPEPDAVYDWGYLAVVGDLLFGSSVKRGATFTGADGEWYDQSNEESHKVTSDVVYALDRRDGTLQWKYRGGLVINPTIAVGEGKMFFIESRNPEAVAMESRRLGDELFVDQHLVALDARTGEKLWERPIEIEGGKWVLYLQYAKGTIVVLGTTHGYHLHAFDAEDGERIWHQDFGWRSDNHGGAMQHPAIVGNTIYTDMRAFDLRTGKVILRDDELPPRRGCGTIAAASDAIFYRHYYHAVWDLETGDLTQYEGLRSGCWLGLIPAGGVVLVPESSAGCQCTDPIQTSIAFVPVPKPQ